MFRIWVTPYCTSLCLFIYSKAHPNKALAQELHASRPDVYKDPNHKPEMAIALTKFEALCGFRLLSEIQYFVSCYPEFKMVLGLDGKELFVSTSSLFMFTHVRVCVYVYSTVFIGINQ